MVSSPVDSVSRSDEVEIDKLEERASLLRKVISSSFELIPVNIEFFKFLFLGYIKCCIFFLKENENY